jgi:hypothetical protein
MLIATGHEPFLASRLPLDYKTRNCPDTPQDLAVADVMQRLRSAEEMRIKPDLDLGTEASHNLAFWGRLTAEQGRLG